MGNFYSVVDPYIAKQTKNGWIIEARFSKDPIVEIHAWIDWKAAHIPSRQQSQLARQVSGLMNLAWRNGEEALANRVQSAINATKKKGANLNEAV